MTSVVMCLRVVGGCLVAYAVIRFMLIGKDHHDRSGNAPLEPTFTALEPDLMRKADRAIKVGVLGGALLGVSYVF